ncbi:fimbria/pilus periplasmic chaperone [Winslowiella toletana]|uniref:fimbria/pilus periplasmic chaperone n=1 Tax=Winslowiella toletana TaxID=92490 RepID=UPI0028BE44DE|nr:fimbria/pilus periplasmic chaperone [Winslowiella toletana]WNN46156.1 fimbria/pilus periplasmic chaperone [Winslowiella toletana]
MRNYRLWSVFSSKSRIPWCVGALLIVAGILPALAVVNVEGTRIVFHQGANAASVTLSNSEKQPTLVQIWSDNGDPMTPPESTHTPLIAVPPVFSMKPGEVRSLRLLLTSQTSLAKDKETLFWLNIYQIPPNTSSATPQGQRVVLPLRLRIKVFIRPAGLDDPVEQDGQKLRFRLQQVQGGQQLQIVNPTPWHMTLTDISYAGQRLDSVMVAPESETTLPVGQVAASQSLSYALINDLGTRWNYTRVGVN